MPATPRLNLQGITILVIEDDEDSRDVLRLMIESLGATVLVASNGREGLALATLKKPRLILCDLRMPVMDGFEFLERLQRYPEPGRRSVIAVTGMAEHTDMIRTWEAGFSGHLVKPFDFDAIVAQLERVFWAHGQRP